MFGAGLVQSVPIFACTHKNCRLMLTIPTPTISCGSVDACGWHALLYTSPHYARKCGRNGTRKSQRFLGLMANDTHKFCLGFVEASELPMDAGLLTTTPNEFCLGFVEASELPMDVGSMTNIASEFCLGFVEASELPMDVDFLTNPTNQFC